MGERLPEAILISAPIGGQSDSQHSLQQDFLAFSPYDCGVAEIQVFGPAIICGHISLRLIKVCRAWVWHTVSMAVQR